MASEKYIKAILYVAVTTWAVLLLASGQKLSSGLLKPLSTVTTIVVFTALGFDLWLWKLPFLHGWFVKRPVIDGTWEVEITLQLEQQGNWRRRAYCANPWLYGDPANVFDAQPPASNGRVQLRAFGDRNRMFG